MADTSDTIVAPKEESRVTQLPISPPFLNPDNTRVNMNVFAGFVCTLVAFQTPWGHPWADLLLWPNRALFVLYKPAPLMERELGITHQHLLAWRSDTTLRTLFLNRLLSALYLILRTYNSFFLQTLCEENFAVYTHFVLILYPPQSRYRGADLRYSAEDTCQPL